MTAAHFRQSKIKLKWASCIETKTVLFYPKGAFKLGSDKELGPFSVLRSVMLLKQSDFFYILSFDAVDAVNLECETHPGGQGTRNKTLLSRWTNERIFAILWAMICG